MITFKVDPTLSNVFHLSWKIIKPAAYHLSSNSTFGHRYGTNRISYQGMKPGSHYLIHRSLLSENFLS
nr:MAG TPA: hypothetical protein [Caudoviricetes sp.]